MPRRPLCLALLATLALACKKEEAPPPKFEPGADAKTTLAKLGGVTLTAPDNLKISEAEGSAKLEGEGFPTITITHEVEGNNGIGTRSKVSMGSVTVTTMIPTASWTCEAESTGDYEDLVMKICESLAAPDNPNVSGMTCATVTGFDAEPVTAAWTATAPRFVECLETAGSPGFSFGFNLDVEGTSTNFSQYSSPSLNKVPAADTCVGAIYDALRKDPALTKEGLEAGRIACEGSYSQF